MREIDLIPRDHLEWRRVRRLLARSAVVLALLIGATALARAALAWRVSQERPLVAQARLAKQQVAVQRTERAGLEARKAALELRLASLRQLQNSKWELALRGVDTAASPRVWLDRLSFAAGAPEVAPATAGAGTDAASTGLKVAPLLQVIEVKGHAVDHAAVTEFMHRLSDQPGIRAVRLLDTGLRRYSTALVVDFSVSAKLVASPQDSP